MYKESIKIADEQGDLYKFMEFKSQDDKVNKEFDLIRKFVRSYIQERIK